MSTVGNLHQKTREINPFEAQMPWELSEIDTFRSPRASDASTSVIVMSEHNCIDDALAISRTPSYSELDEPILNNFLSSQAKDMEDYVENSIKIKLPKRRSFTDKVRRKADQVFHIDFDKEFNKGLVKESETIAIKEEFRMPNLPAVAPFSTKHRKAYSSPTQLFDWESVFDKVETMRSESTRSSIVGLEATCDDLREKIDTLTQTNKRLLAEQKRMKEEAIRNRVDFQKTIDQLVAEVVNLENDAEEKKGMLVFYWENMQVVQEAAEDRRKMLTRLRRDQFKKIKKLKAQHEEEKKCLRKEYKIKQSTLPEIKSEQIELTVADAIGWNYISPLKQRRASFQKEEEDPLIQARRGSMRQKKMLLKPESKTNGILLKKLAERKFEDNKLLQITIVEMSPAKSNNVATIEVMENDPEIANLITKISNASPQPNENPHEVPSDESELTGFGENVELVFNTINSNSPVRNQHEGDRMGRSRVRPVGHQRRRSWSAPANTKVAKGLLRSLQRLTPQKKKGDNSNNRRLSERIAKDAQGILRRASLLTNMRTQNSSGNQPRLSPKRSYGSVPLGSSLGANVNSEGSLHQTNENVQTEEKFLFPGVERGGQRSPNEWKDYDDVDFESLVRDLGNNNYREPIELSVESQQCIFFAPREYYRRRNDKHFRYRKSRSVSRQSRHRRVYSSKHERGDRSPSFTLGL